MTGAERSRIIHKLADLIEANTEELAQLETLVSVHHPAGISESLPC